MERLSGPVRAAGGALLLLVAGALLLVAAAAISGRLGGQRAETPDHEREAQRVERQGTEGIWISPEEIEALPTSGTAWNNLKSEADGSCGTLDLANQDQNNNVCVMAKALAFAGTGQESYRTDVVAALTTITDLDTYDGRALALGRELAAYVIAADLIGLSDFDPTLDGVFRTTIQDLLTTYTHSGPSDLIECHEQRPNNWGTHCGGARAAVAAYLGDTAELDRVAQVFKGWLGDRSSYAGFTYGGPDDDLTWQCDSQRPVGINPAGCTRDGLSIDGVLPDDQRRGGSFRTTGRKSTRILERESYVWEALQGALLQAVILHRAGYPVWEWEDQALLRAVRWLHQEVDYPAEGDDTWQPHIINHYYGTSLPAPTPSRPGKNVGWTDWTHGPELSPGSTEGGRFESPGSAPQRMMARGARTTYPRTRSRGARVTEP